MNMIHLLVIMSTGVLATVGTLLAALSDRFALRRAGVNGKDAYIAKSDVRSETLRLAKHVIAASLGFYVLHVLTYCALTEQGRSSLMTVVQWLVVMQMLLTYNSLADLWGRHFSKHGPQLRGRFL
jgi:hypothetical protein